MSTTQDPFRAQIEKNSDDPDAVEEVIREIVSDTGRVFVILNNAWFANEKVGMWSPYLIADVERVTEKAVLLTRVINGQDAVQKMLRMRQRNRSDQSDGTPPLPWRVAHGEATARLREGWFPKSAVGRMVTAEGPEDYKLYRVDGSTTESVSPATASAVIKEKVVIHRKGRQYRKLAVDADYETGQTLKQELSWEEFHPSPWYVNDEFVVWTVDDSPEKVATELASVGVATAIHRSVL